MTDRQTDINKIVIYRYRWGQKCGWLTQNWDVLTMNEMNARRGNKATFFSKVKVHLTEIWLLDFPLELPIYASSFFFIVLACYIQNYVLNLPLPQTNT